MFYTEMRFVRVHDDDASGADDNAEVDATHRGIKLAKSVNMCVDPALEHTCHMT